MNTSTFEKLPYQFRENRTFAEYVSAHLQTVLEAAENWVEDIYRKRMFTHRGCNICRSPYPNYNAELQGEVSIVTMKGGYVVITYKKDSYKFKANEANKQLIFGKIKELLTHETNGREQATQSYFNQNLGLSLI